MKRIIFLLLLCGMFTVLSAELIEGFESCYEDSNGVLVLPEGWSMVDNDGDDNNWFSYAYNPHSGNQSIASASYAYQVGALTPDNWLISPAITISAGDTLSWWASAQDADYPNDFYSVMLSASGLALEDFTTTLFSETLMNNIWHQVSVDLSAYAGQTIHLAWRHHACTDMFYMKIDDIYVGGGVNGSSTNNIVSNPDYINSVYPNPFNPETTVSLFVEESGYAEIDVFNIKGQKVANLFSGNLQSGNQRMVWKAESQPSGMYLFRLKTANGESFGKAMLMK